MKFSHAKTSTSDILWEITLLGDSDGELATVRSLGQTVNMVSDYVRLPAGNYYIRIKPYFWSDIDYKFSVVSKSEKEETENEWNNDYDNATNIPMGVSINGNIQSEADVDFYVVKLKKKTNVKLTFTHSKMDDENTLWQINLYSTDGDESIMNLNGEAVVCVAGNDAKNIFSKWESLYAGIYYIKVSPYYYSNKDYKLKINNYL